MTWERIAANVAAFVLGGAVTLAWIKWVLRKWPRGPWR